MSKEWGIYNDESADYSAAEAVEAGFWSEPEAREALAARYADEDELTVHAVEEPDYEEDADDFQAARYSDDREDSRDD